jgi:hypothetical protein
MSKDRDLIQNQMAFENDQNLAHNVDNHQQAMVADQSFVQVGLLGYCNMTENNNALLVTRCTTPRISFWFDFAEILIHQTGHVNTSMPNDITDTIELCHRYTRWSISAYITAFSFTVFVLLVGLTAGKSPWGSIFTALCATVRILH